MGTPWQDSGGPCSGGPGKIRAPCMIRGASAAKRAPPWQDLRAVHSRKAVCGAFRIHGARILPKPARFGCMAAIRCQGGALFPSGAPSGMHEARKLPRMAARERIAREYCHGRPPMNALRRNLAAVGRWGRQLAQRVRKAASRSGSTRKARLHARFARRLDAHIRFARRARRAARRARPTGHKKAPLRRTAPSPQTTGANQIRPES